MRRTYKRKRFRAKARRSTRAGRRTGRRSYRRSGGRRYGGVRRRFKRRFGGRGRRSFAKAVTAIGIKAWPLNRFVTSRYLQSVSAQVTAASDVCGVQDFVLEVESPGALAQLLNTNGTDSASTVVMERIRMVKMCRMYYNTSSFPCYYRTAILIPRRDITVPNLSPNDFTDALSCVQYYMRNGITTTGSYMGLPLVNTPNSFPFLNPFNGFEFQRMFNVKGHKVGQIPAGGVKTLCVKRRFSLNRKFDSNIDFNTSLYVLRKGQRILYYQFWGHPVYSAAATPYGFTFGPFTLMPIQTSYASFSYNFDAGASSWYASNMPIIQTGAVYELMVSKVMGAAGSTIPAGSTITTTGSASSTAVRTV